MGYYDIHTHQMPFHKEDIAIINRIVSPMGDMQPGPLLDTVIRSYGIHPWYIYNVKEQMDGLRGLASGPEVVAIGEAGLDTLAESPMDLQKEVFLAQADLAEETHKPLIIHCVKAWADLIACKKAVKPEMPWIIHGFEVMVNLPLSWFAWGFISLSGIALTHRLCVPHGLILFSWRPMINQSIFVRSTKM